MPKTISLPESQDFIANSDSLLKTRSLTRIVIEQNVAKFESLLANGFKPTQEVYEKYQKLKTKLSRSIKGVFPISEKYFSDDDYKAIASKINFSENGSQIPKITRLKLSLRATPNRDHLISLVKDKTNIQLLSFRSYRVSYLSGGNEVIFDLSFEDNKARISMISSYFKNYPNAKTDGDLFPEEIQIAMFKKLIAEHPDVLLEFKNAKKVVVYRKNIANQLSKKNIKQYLELRARNYTIST